MTATIRMSSASRQPKLRCVRPPNREVKLVNHRAGAFRVPGAPAAGRDGAGARNRPEHVEEPHGTRPRRARGGSRPRRRPRPQGRERAGQPVRDGGVLGDPREAPDERLAGGADADGEAERPQRRQVPQQGQVALEGLAEAQAGVDGDRPRGATPAASGAVRGLGERGRDVGHRVVVAQVLLHAARVRPLHVHEDSASAACSAIAPSRSGSKRPAGHVVDEVGARPRAPRARPRPCACRSRSERPTGRGSPSTTGTTRAHLLVHRDLLGFAVERRARRFAAHVHDGGALAVHRERPFDRARRVEVHAAVGEGVGRDVEDAHDERPGREVQPAAVGESERAGLRGAARAKAACARSRRLAGIALRVSARRARDTTTGGEVDPANRTTSTGKSEAEKLASRNPVPRGDLAERLGIRGRQNQIGAGGHGRESNGGLKDSRRRRRPPRLPRRAPSAAPAIGRRAAGRPRAVSKSRGR